MAISIEYDNFRVSPLLKVRRALALPIYALALILSFVSEGLGDVAAYIARDPIS